VAKILTTTRFTIEGKPRGYTTYNRGSKPSKEVREFWDYCKYTRACADIADIELPLEASKESPLMIRTYAFFPNGVHADPENIHKGIKDALFHSSKLGDKYTGGWYAPPMYDKENPRVVVIIEPAEGGYHAEI
jgi:hypothetical protein